MNNITGMNILILHGSPRANGVAHRYNWMLYRKIINNEGGTDNGNLP